MRNIKKIFFTITLSLLSANMVYGCENLTVEDFMTEINQYEQGSWLKRIGNRLYIDSERISLEHNGIHLSAGPFSFQIPLIQYDNIGYYIDVSACQEGWFSWKCCRCYYLNPNGFETCQNCFKRKC